VPTESELRDLLSSAHAPHDLDAQRIIARSRRRRLPRQLAAGAVSVLAVAGISVVAIQTSLVSQPPSTVSMIDQSAEGGAAPEASTDSSADSTIKRAPADRINLCEAPLADVAPSTLGLQLDVAFPATAPVGTDPVVGAVRLTNTGTQTVSGTTSTVPAITLSSEGVVLWHSNGQLDTTERAVTLAPGESIEYEASFVPVRCTVDDDRAEQFRADLPAVTAGDYELSAALDFLPDTPPTDGSTPGLDLVTGPLSTIALQ
jgi:hypothetical protein